MPRQLQTKIGLGICTEVTLQHAKYSRRHILAGPCGQRLQSSPVTHVLRTQNTDSVKPSRQTKPLARFDP